MVLYVFTVNIENKVGAVGFTTRIAPSLYPVTLVKVDPVTGEPVRDRNGVCVHAGPGESLSAFSFFKIFFLTCLVGQSNRLGVHWPSGTLLLLSIHRLLLAAIVFGHH